MTCTTKATYSCHGYELSAQESTNPIHFGHGRDGAMIQDQGFLLAIPIVFFFFLLKASAGFVAVLLLYILWCLYHWTKGHLASHLEIFNWVLGDCECNPPENPSIVMNGWASAFMIVSSRIECAFATTINH